MKRRTLLKLSLASLVFALATFALADFGTARAARRQQPSAEPVNESTLLAFDSQGEPAGPCPLKRTEVRAEVSGFISRVTVTQDFHNPFGEKIEAVYTFPLPASAAVDDMTMRVGDRTIKGRIMRRGEARATYEAARAKGQLASLLNQQRPNVFTQSVANIQPGQQVRVTLSYVEVLKYEGGSYEWSFPTVVGQRYAPQPARDANAGETKEGGTEQSETADASETATQDATDDAAAQSPGASEPGFDVPAVPEGMRAGHDITIEVALDAGVPLDGLKSDTHEIEVERPDERRAVVRLKNRAAIPNRDFVMKYDVAGRKIEDAVLAHRSSRGGFFTLILQPPERVAVEDVTPKELVFVLDTSGSMSGFPIETAKATMKRALEGLNPHDTFNLITFAGDTRILFGEPVAATPQNLARAQKFLAKSTGEGGTEMMKAVRAALAPSDSQAHVRVVCFLTDGHVYNDAEIIAAVRRHPNARVFALGFSASPNRHLLDKMAEYGRGEVDYIPDGGDADSAARRFHERVRNPLLTDISVEWAGLAVSDVYPKRAPDLFGSRPVILSGRYASGGTGRVRLRGKMSGQDFERETVVTLPEVENGHDVLATLWARRRIDDLSAQELDAPHAGDTREKLREETTRLGLDFRLMTLFTSFVAVEETQVAQPGEPRRVDVPTEQPPPTTQPQQVISVGVNGGFSETVTVTAAYTLSASSSTISTTVETNSIQNLPLNGRNLQGLMTVSPGVAPSAGTYPGGGRPRPDFAVNGQRPHANSFLIDGVSANVGIAPGGESPGASAAGTTPYAGPGVGTFGLAALEAVHEFRVETFPVEARAGRAPGAIVNVVTRAGTNELRGSLFEYFAHDATDANDPFANARGLSRPRRRLNDFGGTLGGPVVRDRAFFFGSYEGLRLRQPAFAITDVPSSSARLAAAPALRPFLEAFPVANGATRADGFGESAAVFAQPARLDAAGLRLHLVATDRLQLSTRYNLAGSDTEERAPEGFSLNTLRRVRTRAQTLTGTAVYMISPSMTTELRANYSRVTARGAYALDDFGGAIPHPGGGALPHDAPPPPSSFLFDLGGRGASFMTGGEAASTQRQFNVLGSVEAVRGNHAPKVGFDYRRLSPRIGLRPFERQVFFDGVAGALAGVATRVADFTRTTPQQPVFHNLSVYGQDIWRATTRLTVTYGLRWELAPAPASSDDGRSAPAVAELDAPSRLALAAPGTRLWETTFGNFAPSGGVAYHVPGASGDLVLRAGLRLSFDPWSDETGNVFADSFPFVSGRALFGVPFPAAPVQTTGDAAPPGVPVSVFDPHLKQPYTLLWHVSAERELGRVQTFTASYVGAAGRRLLLTRTLLDANPALPFLRLTTNDAASDYHSAQLHFRRRLSSGLQSFASYTFAKSLDDLSPDTAARALLGSDDRRMERGPSDFDVRHAFVGLLSYELPAAFNSGVGRALLRDWTLDALFNARSARPVNVLYAVPTSYGFAYLRPDLIAGVPLYVEDPSVAGGRRINPAAFAAPTRAQQGTLARNGLRGFPVHQFDLGLRRRFAFNERVSLLLRAEAFNLFNHPNFEDPSGEDATLGTLSLSDASPRPNATFGRSHSARGTTAAPGYGFGPFHSTGGPRTFRFSLKLVF